MPLEHIQCGYLMLKQTVVEMEKGGEGNGMISLNLFFILSRYDGYVPQNDLLFLQPV